MNGEEVVAMTVMVKAKFDLQIQRTLTGGTVDVAEGDIEEIAILWKTENSICFRFTKKTADDHIGRIIDLKLYHQFFDEVTEPKLKSWKEEREPLPGEQLELFDKETE